MNRIFGLALILVLMSGFVCACSDSDTTCDEKTFEASCIDNKTVEICTHNEIAQWQCSTGQVCKEGTCVKADTEE